MVMKLIGRPMAITVAGIATAAVVAAALVLFRPLVAGGQDAAPAASATAPAASATAPAAPAIDPDAARILGAACKYLTDAKAFCLKAEVWEDVVLPNGQKIQTTKTVEVQEQRPDRLHVEVHSPLHTRGMWYENKSLVLLDRVKNLYGVMEAPENIDKMIDFVEDRFGIQLPLGDLLVADPYGNCMGLAKTAEYLGTAPVLGVTCHHLAFTGENADWQVWIADGPKPLVHKIVINYKTKVGSPQYTAILSDWDLQSPISDSVFTFVPPDGAAKIDVKPRQPEDTPEPSAAEPLAPATQPAKQ